MTDQVIVSVVNSESSVSIVTVYEPVLAVVEGVFQDPPCRDDAGGTSLLIDSAIAPLEYNPETQSLGIKTYTFIQTANLAIWVVSHNLNKLYPMTLIKDESGSTVNAEVEAIDNNNLLIKFNQPLTGTVYLS